MLWTFAIIFTCLWLLAMTVANLGLGVHVLLVIGAIFAAMALRRHRRLARG